MPPPDIKPNSGRKLFFGLFVFPLLIAVGMAVLLSLVVFLTHEEETPESLIATIKTGKSRQQWQKAYELSNELNRAKKSPPNLAVQKEIISIIQDGIRYEPKTRAYMTIALSHFNNEESVQALTNAVHDLDRGVQLYALWGLGILDAKSAVGEVLPFLKDDNMETRKMAAYVLGVLGNSELAGELKFLLKDPAAGVRWNAALALARLGDGSGSEVLIKMLERETLVSEYKMPEDEIEKVMINATKGLALIQRPDSIKILESVSRSDTNLKVRQAAINAINFHKSHEVKEAKNINHG